MPAARPPRQTGFTASEAKRTLHKTDSYYFERKANPLPGTAFRFALSNRHMKTSLIIISESSRPRLIWITLRSVFNQRRLPDEIIVAAVGPSFEYESAVEEMAFESFAPLSTCYLSTPTLQKATDKDKATTLLKNATHTATGDYIIAVTEGEILHPSFIDDHCKTACTDPVEGPVFNIPEETSAEVLKTGNFDIRNAGTLCSRRSPFMRPINRLFRLIPPSLFQSGETAAPAPFRFNGNLAFPRSVTPWDEYGGSPVTRTIRLGAIVYRLTLPDL